MATPRSPSTRGDALLTRRPCSAGRRRRRPAPRARSAGRRSAARRGCCGAGAAGDAGAVGAGAGGGRGAPRGAAGGLGLLPPRRGARPALEPRFHHRRRRRARAQPRRGLAHAAPDLGRRLRPAVRRPHGLRRHRVPDAPGAA